MMILRNNKRSKNKNNGPQTFSLRLPTAATEYKPNLVSTSKIKHSFSDRLFENLQPETDSAYSRRYKSNNSNRSDNTGSCLLENDRKNREK